MKRFAVVAVVIAVAVAAWMYLNRPEVIDPSGSVVEAKSVFLVPGYGGGAGSLEELRGALIQEGYEVFVLDIGEGTGDLGEYGRTLAAQVNTAAQNSGSAVHVVGFSAGGVIARAGLVEGSANNIARIVTLGSPHDGTSIASVGATFGGAQCPTACQQLARGSDFLSSLPFPGDNTRWMSVYSPDDAVVIPVETAMLEGSTVINAADLCEASGEIAHSDIPRNPGVIAAVIQFLESGEAAALAAAC